MFDSCASLASLSRACRMLCLDIRLTGYRAVVASMRVPSPRCRQSLPTMLTFPGVHGQILKPACRRVQHSPWHSFCEHVIMTSSLRTDTRGCRRHCHSLKHLELLACNLAERHFHSSSSTQQLNRVVIRATASLRVSLTHRRIFATKNHKRAIH